MLTAQTVEMIQSTPSTSSAPHNDAEEETTDNHTFSRRHGGSQHGCSRCLEVILQACLLSSLTVILYLSRSTKALLHTQAQTVLLLTALYCLLAVTLRAYSHFHHELTLQSEGGVCSRAPPSAVGVRARRASTLLRTYETRLHDISGGRHHFEDISYEQRVESDFKLIFEFLQWISFSFGPLTWGGEDGLSSPGAGNWTIFGGGGGDHLLDDETRLYGTLVLLLAAALWCCRGQSAAGCQRTLSQLCFVIGCILVWQPSPYFFVSWMRYNGRGFPLSLAVTRGTAGIDTITVAWLLLSGLSMLLIAAWLVWGVPSPRAKTYLGMRPLAAHTHFKTAATAQTDRERIIEYEAQESDPQKFFDRVLLRLTMGDSSVTGGHAVDSSLTVADTAFAFNCMLGDSNTAPELVRLALERDIGERVNASQFVGLFEELSVLSDERSVSSSESVEVGGRWSGILRRAMKGESGSGLEVGGFLFDVVFMIVLQRLFDVMDCEQSSDGHAYVSSMCDHWRAKEYCSNSTTTTPPLQDSQHCSRTCMLKIHNDTGQGYVPASSATISSFAVCWQPHHASLTVLSGCAMIIMTMAALHFRIHYGGDRFLGTQGRFNFFHSLLSFGGFGACILCSRLHPAITPCCALSCCAILLCINIIDQPCMDPSLDGVRTNNLRTVTYTACVVTQVIGCVSLGVEGSHQIISILPYCWLAAIILGTYAAFKVNNVFAMKCRNRRVKLVKDDFVALLSSTGVGGVNVMGIAGFFNSGLLAPHQQDRESALAFTEDDARNRESVICEHDAGTQQCRVQTKDHGSLRVEWVKVNHAKLSLFSSCFVENTNGRALFPLETKSMRVVSVENWHGGAVVLEDEEFGTHYGLKNEDLGSEEMVQSLVAAFKHRPWVVAAEEFRFDQRKLWLYCQAFSRLSWAKAMCEQADSGFVDLGGRCLGDVDAIALAFALPTNHNVKALVLNNNMRIPPSLLWKLIYHTIPTVPYFMPGIKQLNQIKKAMLASCFSGTFGIGDIGVTAIAKSLNDSAIETLVLSGCNTGLSGIDALTRSGDPDFKRPECLRTDRTVVKRMLPKQLKRLWLNGNNLNCTCSESDKLFTLPASIRKPTISTDMRRIPLALCDCFDCDGNKRSLSQQRCLAHRGVDLHLNQRFIDLLNRFDRHEEDEGTMNSFEEKDDNAFQLELLCAEVMITTCVPVSGREAKDMVRNALRQHSLGYHKRSCSSFCSRLTTGRALIDEEVRVLSRPAPRSLLGGHKQGSAKACIYMAQALSGRPIISSKRQSPLSRTRTWGVLQASITPVAHDDVVLSVPPKSVRSVRPVPLRQGSTATASVAETAAPHPCASASGLRLLSIDNCHVSDQGMHAIKSAIGSAPYLEHLFAVNCCDGLSTARVELKTEWAENKPPAIGGLDAVAPVWTSWRTPYLDQHDDGFQRPAYMLQLSAYDFLTTAPTSRIKKKRD